MKRGETTYIWQLKGWPSLRWSDDTLIQLLSEVRFAQGRLLGRMGAMGFDLANAADLLTRTEEAIETAAVEGETLARDEVRSSVARRLGVEDGSMVPSSRRVDGLVEMLHDATANHAAPLTEERLLGWRDLILEREIVQGWRSQEEGPMQVVSGPMGRETVHFEAPPSSRLAGEMARYLDWFEAPLELDPLLKAGLAHLWFVTIHPFADGNGRVARALSEMLLARSEGSIRRFYSMSNQIRRTRADYYRVLEWTQKGDLDVTAWLTWFLTTLRAAIDHSQQLLAGVVRRAEFWSSVSHESLNERQLKVLGRFLEDDFEGFLTTSKWARMTKTSQDTAGRDITDLLRKGILVQNPGGGRSTSYRLR
jgi:Fic family protein